MNCPCILILQTIRIKYNRSTNVSLFVHNVATIFILSSCHFPKGVKINALVVVTNIDISTEIKKEKNKKCVLKINMQGIEIIK